MAETTVVTNIFYFVGKVAMLNTFVTFETVSSFCHNMFIVHKLCVLCIAKKRLTTIVTLQASARVDIARVDFTRAPGDTNMTAITGYAVFLQTLVSDGIFVLITHFKLLLE